MSRSAASGPAAAGTADGTLPGAGRQRFLEGLRRRRFWLVCAAVVLVVVLVVGAFGAAGRGKGTLAADNPGPEGAMAVAQVLRSQGVAVQATQSLDASLTAIRAAGGARTTVLLYDPKALLEAGQLRQLASAAGALVLVEPGPVTLSGVTAGISSAGLSDLAGRRDPDAVVRAGCTDADASAAQSIDAGNGAPDGARLYRGPVTCFTTPDPTPAGLFAASADGRVTVLGNRAVLSNGRLDRNGNAALALRTLGKHPQLIWYLPSLKDLPASAAKDLSALVPAWTVPAAGWLLMVGVIAMLWKGRRDGPLVMEPLPVSVSAAETAAGRARLYQQAHATDRAAASLRAGTLLRTARHLKLGRAATAEDVAVAASRHTGRPLPDVRNLLIQFRPRTDTALLAWAQRLEALEKEVTSR